MSQPTIGAAWRAVRDQFRTAGLGTPELDARRLAEMAFELDALGLVTNERELAEPVLLTCLDALTARRLTGEPVARIAGRKEFYGLSFQLNAATLVPRPETEQLVDLALKFLQHRRRARILDLGTGTGAIPIAILANQADASAVAVDLSEEALVATRTNAELLGVANRFTTLHGSWFEPLAEGERFDVIVSNPPYIESATIASLAADVRVHDPMLALDGGPDGLAPYRVIAARAREFLAEGGIVLLEIGSEQGPDVARMLLDAGFVGVEVEKDMAGLDRVVKAHQF